MVAEGTGSYSPGLGASLAAELIIRHARAGEAEPREVLAAAFRLAHQAVARAQSLDGPHGLYSGLGVGATAALLDAGGLTVAHVGDARAYRIREEGVERLTTDQVVEGLPMVVLSQVLGHREPIPALERHDARTGDVLILCTRSAAGLLADAAAAVGGGGARLLSGTPLREFVEKLAALSGGAVAALLVPSLSETL